MATASTRARSQPPQALGAPQLRLRRVTEMPQGHKPTLRAITSPRRYPGDVLPLMLNGDDSTPEQVLSARHAVQEIITVQVVLKDRRQRDVLIDEAVEQHGVLTVRCIVSFICAHTADDVDESIAEARFHYLIRRIGAMCELLATVDDVSEEVVVGWLAGIDYEYSNDPEESLQPEALMAVEAMRAAQTCIIAHLFARRGQAPWGIQKSLALDDMVAVVEMMAVLFHDLVSHFDEEHWASVSKLLLADVEMILRAQAQAQGKPVSQVVSDYFIFMMEQDVS